MKFLAAFLVTICRAAAILAVLLITNISPQERLRPDAATAQQSIHPKTVVDPEEGLPLYKCKYFPPDGWMSPDDRRLLALSKASLAALPPPPPAVMPERIVITHGPGGAIYDHNLKFAMYRSAGLEVEIRGGCYSACTLITAYVGKDKLCIAPHAFLAFHAARTNKHENLPLVTGVMYSQQPAEIRASIDRKGGHENMPLDGFWTMYDHELWAIGYPRCK